MNCMFHECNSLTNINLSNFITQNVTDITDMRDIFKKCNSLIQKIYNYIKYQE